MPAAGFGWGDVVLFSSVYSSLLVFAGLAGLAAAPNDPRSNLQTVPVFRPFLDKMWESSPTFRDQCRRLAAETGLRIAPKTLLAHLAPAYEHWEHRFTTEGFAPLRTEWLAHAARLGETIRARTGQATHEGIFDTVDAEGNLILRTGAGTVAIPAAEVFF